MMIVVFLQGPRGERGSSGTPGMPGAKVLCIFEFRVCNLFPHLWEDCNGGRLRKEIGLKINNSLMEIQGFS